MLAFFPAQLPVFLPGDVCVFGVSNRVSLSCTAEVCLHFLPSAATIHRSVSFTFSRTSLGAVLSHTDTSNIIVGVYRRVWAIGELPIRPIGRLRGRLARQRWHAIVCDSGRIAGIRVRAPGEGEVLVAHRGEGHVAVGIDLGVTQHDPVCGQTGIAVGEPGEVELGAGPADEPEVYGLESGCEGDYGGGYEKLR